MTPRKKRYGRSLRAESLEQRCVLSVTLGDLTAAGISQRVVDYIDTSTYETQILGDATLENTLIGLNSTQTAPQGATVLTTVADLSQITAGTVNNPNVYLIQGDLTLPGSTTIQVPSNVHIYVDGSIFKQGAFSTTGSVFATENTGSNADAIFRLNGADNVKLIGVNNALLHSNPTLDASQPHTTAVFIHSNSTNVEVDGFEMAYIWNGVAAHPFNIHDITVTNNYIHDTLNRAIWSLGTTNFRAAHNFVENAAMDSFDWDAFTNDAIGYENVSIGAGRWAGFVEEGTEDSYFIRGLGMIADFGNPNRGFMLGWADNGSSPFFVGNNPNPSQWTEHNYFIDNVIFTEGDVPQSGGDYFAKNNAGKGPTYFWANRGFGAGQSTEFFDNAEWLTFLPTAGGRNNAVNAVQLLADLDAEFNNFTGIVLSASAAAGIPETAPIGTVVATVTPVNANVEDLTFEITAGNTGDAFAIDDDGVVTVAGALDFTTQPTYTLTVEATDGVETGSTTLFLSVLSPFATVETLLNHDFTAPGFFDASDIRGQQGWTAQNGWGVADANGQGYAASSTTAFQGVTNSARADVEAGETIRVELVFDIDVNNDSTSDQFRFGVTTLDSGGSFIPSLGNNGGSIVSGLVRYDAGSEGLVFVPAEGTGASIPLADNQVGIDRGAGDNQTDPLRATWEATKSATSGQWDVRLVVENLATGQTLGEQTTSVTQATAYGTTGGLYAGVRGLQNSSQSDFRIDRFAYQLITPGAAIPGDYNADGTVDAADYSVWRDTLGQTGTSLGADGDRDGAVTQDDYDVWVANYGATAVSQSLSLATAPVATPNPQPADEQPAPAAAVADEATPAQAEPLGPAFALVSSSSSQSLAAPSVARSSPSPEAARDEGLLLLAVDSPASDDAGSEGFGDAERESETPSSSPLDEAFGLGDLL